MFPKNTSISVHLVRILVRFMTRHGFDIQDGLDEAKANPLMLRDNRARVSTHQFYTIWESAVKRKNDANMGLHFGQELGHAYFTKNLLFGTMAGAGTVKKALSLFCRYHALSEDAVLPKIRIEKGFAFLSWEAAFPDFSLTRHISEALLCAYVLILRNIAEDHFNPIEIRLSHGQPPDIREHRDIFKAPFRFDQPVNEIVLHAKDLDLPVFSDDPDLVQTLVGLSEKKMDQLYDSTLWTARARQVIGERLTLEERTDIHAISSILAVSPRNLQGKLREENTTFQKILDQERLEMASRYLSQKRMPICDIALHLGFSEQSTFNHAFRRWTGLTPGKYRKLP
ncbi:MAG: hypothetical protein A3J85_04400 [Desulfobacula sp. RIFOXYA12_FULL_46_16]|nr:MAG: hypothetical protein A3J85_04400 [Desulfobacula sp. RIFOXYA12_FULL_46_16]